jgi:integrase
MAQAKTLTQAEIDQVLRYTSKSRYATRNRCLILTSFWSGMRVAEIANLKMRDVLNEDQTIKTEIRLSAELYQWITQKNLKVLGAPQLARYNPPWTLPFLRRNELMVEVE